MKLHKYILALGVAAIVGPTASFAEDAGLTRDVKFFTGGTYPDPGIVRAAKAVDIGNWATPEDFPTEVTVRRMYMNVRVSVALDASGKVTGCGPADPQYSLFSNDGENKSLIDWVGVTCALITERGKFTYAIDPNGMPVPSEYRMTAQFEVRPEGTAGFMPPPAPWPASKFFRKRAEPKKPLKLALKDPSITNTVPRAFVDIDTKGKTSGCRVSVSTGSDKSDAAVCRYLLKQKFSPAIGQEGTKVAENYFQIDLPITRQ